MHILITGGAGFIGSHLAEALLQRDEAADVTLFDNLSTGTRENVERLLPSPRIRLVQASISSREEVDAAVAEADVVYHLAASVGVRHFIDHPVESYRTNVDGSGNVLRAVADKGVPTFVASSSEVYGNSPLLPFREDNPLGIGATSITRWGYACAKAMDEFVALAYHQELGLPVRIGRFFNTVGPRQTGRYGMVIPRFVDQALRGEDIVIYGDGEQTRCFTYVNDVIERVLLLMDAPDANGEVVNVAGGEKVTIRQLAERVVELTNSGSEITHISYDEAFPSGFEDVRHRVPDTSKLEQITGLSRASSLETILTAVIEDREAHLNARG